MNLYTSNQIENTINMINSLIINCEKIQPKLKEGSPQLSLNKNRIKALYISKALIIKQGHDYKSEDLINSKVQIKSIINKSNSGITTSKEGSSTYTRFRKIIDAMTIALSYIEDAINWI